jgi:hypothetical protein
MSELVTFVPIAILHGRRLILRVGRTTKWNCRFHERGSGVILIPCGEGCTRELARDRTTNIALSRMATSHSQSDRDAINCVQVIDGIWSSQQSAGPQCIFVGKMEVAQPSGSRPCAPRTTAMAVTNKMKCLMPNLPSDLRLNVSNSRR